MKSRIRENLVQGIALLLLVAGVQLVVSCGGSEPSTSIQDSQASTLEPSHVSDPWVVQSFDADIQASIQNLLNQIEQEPSNSKLRTQLAKLYDANGYDSGARVLYRQSVDLDQSDFETRYLYARRLHLDGLHGEAISQAQEALLIDSHYAPLHLLLGQWYLENGEFDRARNSLNRAAALNIGPIAPAWQAQVLLKLDDVEGAIEILNDLLEESQHPFMYRLMSTALLQQGDFEGARLASTRAQEATTIWYDDPLKESMFTLATGDRRLTAQAQRLLSQGQVHEAIQLLEDLIERDPEILEGHYHLGLAYLQLGLTDASLSHLQRAVVLEPVHYPSHLLIASIHQQRDDNQSAKKHLESVVEIFPQLHIAHQELGFVHLRLGKNEEALNSFRQAIAYDSTAPNVHYYTGVILGEKNECLNAIPYFQATLDLDENHAKAHMGLATCFEALNQPESASKHLQLAHELSN